MTSQHDTIKNIDWLTIIVQYRDTSKRTLVQGNALEMRRPNPINSPINTDQNYTGPSYYSSAYRVPCLLHVTLRYVYIITVTPWRSTKLSSFNRVIYHFFQKKKKETQTNESNLVSKQDSFPNKQKFKTWQS